MGRADLGVDAVAVALEPAGGAHTRPSRTNVPAGAGNTASPAVVAIARQIAADAATRPQAGRTLSLASPCRAFLPAVTCGRARPAVRRMVRVGAHPRAAQHAGWTGAGAAGTHLPAGAAPPAGPAVPLAARGVYALAPAADAPLAARGSAYPVVTDLTLRAYLPAATAVGRVGGGVHTPVGAAELQVMRTMAASGRADLVRGTRVAAGPAVRRIRVEVNAAALAVGQARSAAAARAHTVLAELPRRAGRRAGAAVGRIALKVGTLGAARVAAGRARAYAADTSLVRATRGPAGPAVARITRWVNASPVARRSSAGTSGRAHAVLADLAGRATPRAVPAVDRVLLHRGTHPIAQPLTRVWADELIRRQRRRNALASDQGQRPE